MSEMETSIDSTGGAKQTSAFFEFDPTTLAEWAAARKMPAFVTKQIMEWVYTKGVIAPAQMTNLSKLNRERLEQEMIFEQGRVEAEMSASDGTQKLLLAWPDSSKRATSQLPIVNNPSTDRTTECVMIPNPERKTACVSSQVGCPVGCKFCASGIGGLEGNLTRGRIVEQAWRLGRLKGVERISHVVFMGMGEPLANFSAVTDAIRTLNAPWGMGISARRITLSTVGLPSAIRKLVGFEIPVTLALSLHAPNDEMRRKIIPWAEYSTIEELLDACDEYFRATGREITLEYIVLGGFNDRPEHADELSVLARKLRANVNLIRWNEVADLPFRRPLTEDVLQFQEVLRSRGVNVHIRASRGRDIAAACGQLRHEVKMGATAKTLGS
ncbi:putative dual-specificity RNA methyltransferase RlmN [Phycisphaerae bacterium]|nr:putative dual-specificity RNA methyltransferase RlmN [Phycisphaerae bacterium]